MENQETNKVTGIYLEFDGKEKVNIRDLPKEDYEKFLDSMNQLRLVYITLTNRPQNE